MNNPNAGQRLMQMVQSMDQGMRGRMSGLEGKARQAAMKRSMGNTAMEATTAGKDVSAEAMKESAQIAASHDKLANFLQTMAGTGGGDRVIQGAVYGSGMTAGAAGLIAIMQALQGAQDNQERRDYPLQ
tara:strand:- start:87 stop:473 length:387 start_codon:yes stop_codon:yes gene_type:complete